MIVMEGGNERSPCTCTTARQTVPSGQTAIANFKIEASFTHSLESLPLAPISSLKGVGETSAADTDQIVEVGRGDCGGLEEVEG